MHDDRWNVPRTEAGLQTLLERLDENRAAGDERAVGWGLLALARLVGWVRSDNLEHPFLRAGSLADDAIEIFRREGDDRGLMAALRSPAMHLGPEGVDARLAEALQIAERLEDDREIARTLAAKGRALGVRDREAAAAVNRQALEVFRRLNDRAGQGGCLFSLSIGPGTSAEKYGYDAEGARLFHESGNFDMAARCATVAVMNGEETMSWTELEPLVRQGLADAVAAIDAGMEATFYGHLAKVAEEKGDVEEAAECLHRQDTLKDHDGLTPAQRRRRQIDTAKFLLDLAKKNGDPDRIASWEQHLKSLRRRRRPDR